MVYMDHMFLYGIYAIYMVYMDHMFLYGIYANSVQTTIDFSQMQQIARS